MIVVRKYPQMTPDEFDRARAHFGLTEKEFAVVVGVELRQLQRYHYAESQIPGAVARLLRAAVQHNLSADNITCAPVIRD
jgi:DNA-binding transcriptional regulator YiaG